MAAPPMGLDFAAGLLEFFIFYYFFEEIALLSAPAALSIPSTFRHSP
jgi:hypothetical protein